MGLIAKPSNGLKFNRQPSKNVFFFLDHSPSLGTDDLFRVRILFLFFAFDIYRCKICFQNYTPRKIFFSVQEFFPPGISFLELFSFEISLWEIFFLKSPIPSSPQKSGLLGLTLGARDFSSAVSGFCQVFIVTLAKSFAARGFGLRPKMCRPSANSENSHRTREKPLVPRVLRASS